MTDELPFDPRPRVSEVVGAGLAAAIAKIEAEGGRVWAVEVDRHHPARYTLRIVWLDPPVVEFPLTKIPADPTHGMVCGNSR